MITAHTLEKIADYPEIADIDAFIEKHVDEFSCWQYFSDDIDTKNYTIDSLYNFYHELCDDCEVDPVFSYADLEQAMRDLYELLYQED